jgi:hypothetical protein
MHDFEGLMPMNVIVRKHYPVDKLPEDLREGLPRDGLVTIEILPEQGDRERPSLRSLVGTGRNVHGDEAAVVARIRDARDDA